MDLPTEIGPRSIRLLGEQVRQGRAQNLGDEAEIQDGNISLASFHGADESAVQLAAAGQFSLSPLAGKPKLTDAKTQVTKKMLVVEVHT